MQTRFIEDYPPLAMTMNATGEYAFPNMPCGVLSFHIKDKHLVWGCVESNRVGPIAVTPPTGTQDIIVYKNNQRLVFEAAKPFPDTEYDCLIPFKGKSFSGETYQQIIRCLLANKFAVYLENPIATAIHETREEHGADFRKNGKNIDNVIEFYDFAPQTVLAKRGTTTQKVVVAYLQNIDGIELKYTDKIEQKIPINKGHSFYERGDWKTLDEIKTILKDQFSFYHRERDKNRNLSDEQLALCQAELSAFESRTLLIDKIERSIVNYLSSKNIELTSSSAQQTLDFTIINNPKLCTENSSKQFHGLRFLSHPTTKTDEESSPEVVKSLQLG